MIGRVLIGGMLLLVSSPALADPTEALLFLVKAAAIFTLGPLQAFLVVTAASVYGSIENRKKAKRAAEAARQAYNATLTDRTITALTSAPARRYVMGRAIVGGDIINILTSDKQGVNSNGTIYTKKDALKHVVVTFASHECQALNEVYIAGRPVGIGSLDSDGWAVTGDFGGTEKVVREVRLSAGETIDFGHPPTVITCFTAEGMGDGGEPNLPLTPSGNTVTNTYAHAVWLTASYTNSRGSVRVSWHLGTDAQAADAYLTAAKPADWTSTDRLAGLAYAVITLDLENTEFQGGQLAFTFDVAGVNAVEDPRTATTGYTENAALLVRWFLMLPEGKGLLSSEIDAARAIAAANACDVSTSFVTYDEAGTPTTTTGPRYTINGAFTSADNPDSVLQQMCEAMGGWAAPSDLWVIQAGAWEEPVLTLTADDMAGPAQIVQHATAWNETFNSCRGRYMPRGQQVDSDAPEWSNAAYLAADGEALWDDATWPYTDSPARVRNLQRIHMERQRGAFVVSVPFKLKAWPLQPGDRVTWGSAENNIPTDTIWRVTDWSSGLGAPVVLTLQMDTADMYDEADAPVVLNSPVLPVPDPWYVAAPTSVTAESGPDNLATLADGTINVRVLVEWAAPGSNVASGGTTEITWRRQGNDTPGAWQKTRVTGGEVAAYINNQRAGAWLTIGVTHINGLGKASQTAWLSHSVVGKDEAPSDVTGFAGSVAKGRVLFVWDTPPDSDYRATEIRASNTGWGDGSHLWQGSVDEWQELVNTTGALTRYARHIDTSGNYSATSASDSLTVTAADLVQDGTDGAPAAAIGMSAPSITLSANAAGQVSSYSGAVCTLTVTLGGVDDTANWSFSRTNGTDVSSTLSANVLTVTALTDGTDSTHIDVTATRAGYASLPARIIVTKQRSAAGVAGQLSGWFVSQTAFAVSGTATATITFEPDGSILGRANAGADSVIGHYYQPNTTGIGSSTWVRASLMSGSTPTGPTVDGVTWHSLSSSAAFGLPQVGLGNKQSDIALLFSSDSSGTTIIGNGHMHLEAEIS